MSLPTFSVIKFVLREGWEGLLVTAIAVVLLRTCLAENATKETSHMRINFTHAHCMHCRPARGRPLC